MQGLGLKAEAGVRGRGVGAGVGVEGKNGQVGVYR